MVSFNDLEQLVAFYRTGRLSETAELFHLSPSALTRSMQWIERDFSVKLFDRSKNHIALNEAGILAARQAELVLSQQAQMFRSVRDFDRLQHTITVGTCLPVPVFDPYQSLTPLFPDATIASEIKGVDLLLEGLKSGRYQLVVLPYYPDDPGLVANKLQEEYLLFCIPVNHPLAKRDSVSFSEINGENILLYHEAGFWYDVIHDNMPDSHILPQAENFALMELVENSTQPTFTSNLTLFSFPLDNRVTIPVSYEAASVTYYLVCKKEDKGRFRGVL